MVGVTQQTATSSISKNEEQSLTQRRQIDGLEASSTIYVVLNDEVNANHSGSENGIFMSNPRQPMLHGCGEIGTTFTVGGNAVWFGVYEKQYGKKERQYGNSSTK